VVTSVELRNNRTVYHAREKSHQSQMLCALEMAIGILNLTKIEDDHTKLLIGREGARGNSHSLYDSRTAKRIHVVRGPVVVIR